MFKFLNRTKACILSQAHIISCNAVVPNLCVTGFMNCNIALNIMITARHWEHKMNANSQQKQYET
jgi:hypothetical protein